MTIALLTALRAEQELALHIRATVRNGLTPDEIAEVIMHTAAYAGIPAANTAMAIAKQVLSGPEARRDDNVEAPEPGRKYRQQSARIPPRSGSGEDPAQIRRPELRRQQLAAEHDELRGRLAVAPRVGVAGGPVRSTPTPGAHPTGRRARAWARIRSAISSS